MSGSKKAKKLVRSNVVYDVSELSKFYYNLTFQFCSVHVMHCKVFLQSFAKCHALTNRAQAYSPPEKLRSKQFVNFKIISFKFENAFDFRISKTLRLSY